jgi:hypothetical protein
VKLKAVYILVVIASVSLKAQHEIDDKFSDPHHHRHPLRAAVLLGHGMVPEVGGEGIYFVPTWGIDLDYHLSDYWSIGWHSDVELENYVIITDNGTELEIETPMISTLDIFYRLNHNLIVGIGPGLTKENTEIKTLIRLGLEAEVPLNDRWEWTPTLYLDQRVDGHSVWTFAVGVAHYL